MCMLQGLLLDDSEQSGVDDSFRATMSHPAAFQSFQHMRERVISL